MGLSTDLPYLCGTVALLFATPSCLGGGKCTIWSDGDCGAQGAWILRQVEALKFHVHSTCALHNSRIKNASSITMQEQRERCRQCPTLKIFVFTDPATTHRSRHVFQHGQQISQAPLVTDSSGNISTVDVGVPECSEALIWVYKWALSFLLALNVDLSSRRTHPIGSYQT